MRIITLSLIGLLILTCHGLATASTENETLELVRKNPRNWQRIDTQTTAQLCFSRQLGSFTCTGQHLESAQRYALIQHDETTGRGQGYIVAFATTSADGRIKLTGNWHRWSGKVWLVIAKDVRGEAGDKKIDQLIHWQPTRYLFESQSLL